MKNSRCFFVMMICSAIAAFVLPGVFAQPPKQSIDSSLDASVDSQTESTRSSVKNDHAKNSLLPSKKSLQHIPSQSHTKPISTRPARSTNTIPESISIEAQTEIRDAHPATSSSADSTSVRAVSHRNSLAPLPAASLNRQQFKSSRDSSAHLTVSGGPANSTHGTAALSGTGMKPKP